jgi:dolichyl-phosphate beta-glucosyltransferase
LVSDGSKDRTVKVAKGFTTPNNLNIRTLEYHPNRGKGYAVRYGMLRAKSRILMFMDADYAVPIENCEQGIELIKQGYHIAIGSRAINGARIKRYQNILRIAAGKIYTFIQNYFLGLHYPDTQCGFKLFTNASAKVLFNQQKLNSVIFDPEILWLAKREGYLVGQFPVQWRHVENSRIQYDSINKSIFVFRELLKIKCLN